MVFSDYTKRRILLLRERGKRTKEISELLLKEDIRASHRGISKFLSRYKQRGTIVRKKGSGKNTLRCTVFAPFFAPYFKNADTAIKTRKIVKWNGNEHGTQNYRCTVACFEKRELFCGPYCIYILSGEDATSCLLVVETVQTG